MDRQIKDIEERLKKLEEGKHKNSNYNEQKKSLDRNKEHCQHFKDECQKSHYLKTAKPQALLDIESKLDQVKKLGESLNGLTDEKQCKKLLENLCTGLQTFLGFNPSSKGYDGSGIVYSDLDRLCDAVMGFLSGVLGAVKDDDEVTTYDQYITGDNKNLKSVLKFVDSNIGSGRDGLVASADAVKGWLEGYEKSVKEKTENVKMQLKTIISNNITDRHIPKIETEKSNSLMAIHEAVDWSLNDLAGNMKTLRDNEIGYNALDVSLKNKLEMPLSKIEACISMLQRAASDGVREHTVFVDKQLNIQRENVKRKTNEQCNALRDALQGEFKNVIKKIAELKKEKSRQIDVFNDLLNGDEGLLRRFENEYKNKNWEYFREIKRNVIEVYESLKKKQTQLYHLVSAMQVKLQGLSDEFADNVKENVKKDLEGLKTGINDLMKNIEQRPADNNLVSGALKALRLAKNAFTSQTVSNITKASDQLKEQYESNFKQQFHEFTEALEKTDLDSFKADLQDKSRKLENYFNNLMRISTIKTVSPSSSGEVNLLVDEINSGISELEGILKKFSSYDCPNRDSLASALQKTGGAINALGSKIRMEFIESKQIIESSRTHAALAAATEQLRKLDNLKRVVYGSGTTFDKPGKDSIAGIINNISAMISGSGDANTGLDKAVDKFNTEAISQITGTAKKSIADAVAKLDADIKQSGKGKPGTHNLQTVLQELRQKFDVLQRYMTSGQSGHIDSLIKEIDIDLGKLYDIKKDETGGIIYDKSKSADVLMDKLKSEIRNVLAVVSAADIEIQNSIDAVQSTVIKSSSDAKQAVRALQSQLTDAVERAFDATTKYVRNLFAESHRADLSALRSLVDSQLQQVQAIIAKDRVTGVKGMLSKLKDKYVGKLDEYAPKPTTPDGWKNKTFHGLVEEIDKAFKFFFGNLERQPDFAEVYGKVQPSQVALNNLLDALKKSQHFDYIFLIQFERLSSNLHDFVPKNFSTPCSSLLAPLKRGLSKFAEQLGHAYVSRYSGRQFNGGLLKDKPNDPGKQPAKPPVDELENKELTPEGRNCAKVCLTIVEIMGHDLGELRNKCEGQWNKRTICLKNANMSHNDLGLCLKRFGYGVPSEAGKQDNELRCHEKMNGNEIFAKLIINTITTHEEYNVISNLKKLTECLATYYRVCHLPTTSSTKYPSSVYQMLTWLSGLAHNPVYEKLYLNGFADLFPKSDKAAGAGEEGGLSLDIITDETDGSSIGVSTEDDNRLKAYPEMITAGGLSDTLALVCSGAHDVLTSILGHGHSGGRYAVNFNTNEDKFSYPSDMVTLVCWILDIIKRVHHQLYFLYRQCYLTTDRKGWRECYYGRHVGGSSWDCNTLQCPNQTCEQKCKQTCKQIHEQMGDQHPNCGLKSPLQSFLEDGLQGFLPHQVKFERGKMECAVKGHFSLPCKTPMGFADIGEMASHTHRGKHIYVALASLCGDESSPLSKLCGQLSCLLPSAPKTLDDMFGFYYNLLNDWNERRAIGKRAEYRETAYKSAVYAANFENDNTTLDITTMFKNRDHGNKLSGRKMTHLTGDLYALVDCVGESSTSSHPCGPYLRPICQDMCATFTKDNADKYVSWIVYCTGSFLDLLKQLYEECSRNCDGDRPTCRVSKCKNGCKAYNLPASDGSTHTDSCNSIVNCKFMRPTFYKYGFVLGDCKSLSAKTTKRTCKDLCIVLASVTNEKEVDGHPLAKLVYRTIPEFLYQIRFPFMTLTLALWLLSLLYLLHIMVIRLDLLHIKSHLHSPSSHRIAAQSLLTAGRVGRLAKISYLQP